MKVSLVAVCHFSSHVLNRCVESFRREAAAAGVASEVVAVEHSEDAAERIAVKAAGADRLLEQPNRGYAAGLNAGICSATGDVLFLANPDIFFFPGSVAALLKDCGGTFDIVGPQFVWDAEGAVLLPPAEDPSPTSELGRTLRRLSQIAWSAGLSRTLEQYWHLWTAEETVAVGGLRGALLAVTAETVSNLGPFDEGYFLYFEETEWLWRARQRGARLGLAANARVQHRWGHSTGQNGGAGEREKMSRQRFFSRNYNRLWRCILHASGAWREREPMRIKFLDDSANIPEAAADLWLASPFPHLVPALGCLRARTIPPEFLEFCRTWRWVVAAAVRTADSWMVTDAWTWGRR